MAPRRSSHLAPRPMAWPERKRAMDHTGPSHGSCRRWPLASHPSSSAPGRPIARAAVPYSSPASSFPASQRHLGRPLSSPQTFKCIKLWKQIVSVPVGLLNHSHFRLEPARGAPQRRALLSRDGLAPSNKSGQQISSFSLLISCCHSFIPALGQSQARISIGGPIGSLASQRDPTGASRRAHTTKTRRPDKDEREQSSSALVVVVVVPCRAGSLIGRLSLMNGARGAMVSGHWPSWLPLALCLASSAS